MRYISFYESPLGRIMLGSEGDFLSALYFEGEKSKHFILRSDASKRKNLPLFDEAKKWLDIYFSGKEPDFLPPIRPEGSGFRKTVTAFMLAVPFGRVTSYGDIAKAVAAKTGKERMSARAVGAAAGRNPIAIMVPCHRVIGSDGSLTGFAGGVERKAFLLENEGIDSKDRSLFLSREDLLARYLPL